MTGEEREELARAMRAAGVELSPLEALAIAWCVLRPGEEPPDPWRGAFAPIGGATGLPRVLLSASRADAERLALACLRLADWPTRGTPAERFATCWAAATARALGLPVTPATIRDMQSADKLTDAMIGAMVRGEL